MTVMDFLSISEKMREWVRECLKRLREDGQVKIWLAAASQTASHIELRWTSKAFRKSLFQLRWLSTSLQSEGYFYYMWVAVRSWIHGIVSYFFFFSYIFCFEQEKKKIKNKVRKNMGYRGLPPSLTGGVDFWKLRKNCKMMIFQENFSIFKLFLLVM